MAIYRPHFSHRPKAKAKVKSAPVIRKEKKGPSSRAQSQSSFSRMAGLLCLLSVLFSLSFVETRERGVEELISYRYSNREGRHLAQEAQTTLFGNVGLTEAQMKKVALNILTIANNMSTAYEVADGITLASYVLRYFAEIGEYEIAYRDIIILVDAFESMTNTTVATQVRDILDQVLKIRFGRRDGRYFAQFFAKNPLRGIIIPIEEVSEDPESSLREIKYVTIDEQASLSFEEVDTEAEKEYVRDFIKKPVKLLGVIDGVLDALNQIHPPIKTMVDSYLEDPNQTVPPLMIRMTGISVDISTTTVFNDITFNFNEAYAFPRFRQGEEPLPSFVLGGKSKLLRLKVSIDQ